MNNLKYIIKYFREAFCYLTSFIAVNRCVACGDMNFNSEKNLCDYCLISMSTFSNASYSNNRLEELLGFDLSIKGIYTLSYYKQGTIVQRAIHALKYKGVYDVGITLGMLLGQSLEEYGLGTKIDVIVPVPLHPEKQRLRGYNQSKAICEGLAKELKKEINENIIIRNINTKSQALQKSKIERWRNTQDAFHCMKTNCDCSFSILLVDDIITTGSTLLACVDTLRNEGFYRIYIAALACV